MDIGSIEQEKRLAKALAEAKELIKLEEQRLNKVIEKEAELGQKRVSYLKEYNEGYSTLLNSVSSQCKDLHKDLLKLSKQVSENSKKLDSKSKSQGTADSKEDNSRNKSKSEAVSKKTAKDLTDAVKSLTMVISDLQKAATGKSSYKYITTTDATRHTSKGSKGASGGGGGPGGSDSGAGSTGTKVTNVVDPDTRKLLEQQTIIDALSTLHKPVQETETVDQAKVTSAAQIKDLNDRADKYYSAIRELEIARLTSLEDTELTEAQLAIKKEQLAIKQADLEIRTAEARLQKLQEVEAAEKEAENFLSKIAIELAYASQAGQKNEYGYEYNEAGENRAKKVTADDTLSSAKALEAQRLKWVEKQELEAKRRNNGILSKEEATRIQKEAASKFKFDKDNLDKLTKEHNKLETAKAHAAERKEMRDGINTMRTAETFEERKQALYNLTHDESGEFDKSKALSAAITAISDLAKQLESKIDSIAVYKGGIDTRLQGSDNKKYLGSYWDQLTRDMKSVGLITPFFKQEKFAENIKSLVDQGISFDLKQRAFLMTIQEKIANTFDVADGTLLRLVRLQQEDSTAGRLGMESALNTFLNEMYENTEYLKGVASSVRSNLEEMEALMGGAVATEVEYQVQKWMGSLYSVGMSQNAVTAISSALGQIASGQIDALTGGGAGNLLVMAATNAGMSIADILTDGLNADETNKLLQATVNYLAEIADSSKDNNVVQQQLANVFGVKASDLRAATNLAVSKDGQKSSIGDIFGEYKSYDNMLNQLYKMAGSMAARTSIGEMMTNIWENGQYSIASSIANSPISYLTYKLASLLDSAVGGIDLPFVNVMGFGVDLNTTVSDLMRVASVGGGLLANLGPMISGLATSFSGRGMLSSMGIKSGSGLEITPRGGEGLGASDGGSNQTTSSSGYVGNASSSDVKNSTINESKQSKKQQMIEAKEEEPDNQVDMLNTYVLKIYEILDQVASGSKSLRVRVDNYGLTGVNSGAQGGVNGLLNNSSANTSNNSLGDPAGSFGTADSTSSLGNSTTSGTISLGGWTTT